MIDRLSSGLITHRRAAFFITIVAMFLVSLGVMRLEYVSHYTVFFDDDHPLMQEFREMDAEFGANDNALIIVDARSSGLFTAASIKDLKWLTAQAWKLPYVRRVNGITNTTHTEQIGDELRTDYHFDELDAASMEIAKTRLQADPLIVGTLLGKSSDITAVAIEFNLPYEPTAAIKEIMNEIEILNASLLDRQPQWNLYVHGIVPSNHAFAKGAEQDGQLLVPLMLVVLFGLLALFTRGLDGIITALSIAFASILFAMGIVGWFGLPMNQVNLLAGMTLLTLAIADAVHILDRYHLYLQETSDREDAMRRAIRTNLKPVTITSMTTAIGFLSLLFSDLPPYRELGLMTALGAVFALLASLTFIPYLVLRRQKTSGKSSLAEPWINAFCGFFAKHYRYLSIPVVLLTAFALVQLPRMEVDDRLIEYFDKRVEFRQAADFSIEHLGGFDVVYYVLDSGKANGVFNAELLHTTENFAFWLRSQPEVTHVASISGILKRLHNKIVEDEESGLPQSSDVISQLFLTYELSLPLGADANQWVNMDRSQLRVSVMLNALSAKQLANFDKRTQNWIAQNYKNEATPLIQNEAKATSVMSILSYTAIGALDTMIKGNIAAVLFIGLLSALWFRSTSLGLITLVPNLLPTMIALGLWSWFDLPLNLASSVVFCVAFGVIIDDTIHFITHFQRLRISGRQYQEAITNTFVNVGPALVKTTVLLAAGFACLGLSTFALNSVLGSIVALAMITALLFDFTILPLLLALYRPTTRQVENLDHVSIPVSASNS